MTMTRKDLAMQLKSELGAIDAMRVLGGVRKALSSLSKSDLMSEEQFMTLIDAEVQKVIMKKEEKHGKGNGTQVRLG